MQKNVERMWMSIHVPEASHMIGKAQGEGLKYRGCDGPLDMRPASTWDTNIMVKAPSLCFLWHKYIVFDPNSNVKLHGN